MASFALLYLSFSFRCNCTLTLYCQLPTKQLCLKLSVMTKTALKLFLLLKSYWLLFTLSNTESSVFVWIDFFLHLHFQRWSTKHLSKIIQLWTVTIFWTKSHLVFIPTNPYKHIFFCQWNDHIRHYESLYLCVCVCVCVLSFVTYLGPFLA